MLACADARRLPLPDDSVQCIVTSPPYWGLRKYAGEQELIWDPVILSLGDRLLCEASEHDFSEGTAPRRHRRDGDGGSSPKQATNTGISYDAEGGSVCRRCGAWRGAYGLEPRVGMYVQHSILVLEECRRVLRPDGVLFWNLGDSYASGKGTCFNPGGGFNSLTCHAARKDNQVYPLNRGNVSDLRDDGLKPKDLALIPERVALAAQAAGWWVRARIIWEKPNTMPESVDDRPTKSHETIWMLTKSARYFWDKYAVVEPKKESTLCDLRTNDDGRRNDVGFPGSPTNRSTNLVGGSDWRNMRDVWEIPAAQGTGAHFATFPEEIPRRCIMAATSAHGACASCRAPYRRLVEVKPSSMSIRVRDAKAERAGAEEGYAASDEEIENYGPEESGDAETIGWEKTCACATDGIVPCRVLDPFGGSGTTGRAAISLRREPICFDLAYTRARAEDKEKGREYEKLARERMSEVQVELFS